MNKILDTMTAASVIALSGGALLGSSVNEASAQSACYTQCVSSAGWGEEKCKAYCYGDQTEPQAQALPQSKPQPQSKSQVFGYVRRADDRDVRRAGCGAFHYWNGRSCIDARVESPND
jgi:hypothetical protein